MRLNTLLRSWALLAAALCAGTVQAELHAVLVGVSGYPTLDKSLRLEGPRNDVQRMRQVLLQRGFSTERITLLADGVAGATDPTRANILQALQSRIRLLKAGDTLLVYFAGHGSQQPADRRTPEGREEADGLHEIFLPIDIGTWDGKAGHVRNAIVDHELRALVDQALGRGAFVWGVFDACHSASLVRGGGADPEVRFRHVSPAELGVTTGALDAATADAVRTRGGPASDVSGPLARSADAGPSAGPIAGPGAGRGGSAFFYAAQTTELTPEMRLPFGDPQRMSYGLFSFMLIRALELGYPMSYRQLGQYVLSQYGSIQEARVTPLFSGNALDQQVLGQTRLVVRQWPVAAGALSVPTGTLSGVAPGALFAVLPGPEAPVDAALGYLQAGQVSLNQTTLVPVAHAGKPVLETSAFKPGMQARLVSNPERLSLRVALDARDCRTDCAWLPALDRLKAQGVPGADLQWVASGADLLLRLSPASVVALPPSEQGPVDCGKARACPEARRGTTLLNRPPGSTVDTDTAVARLSESLHAMARAGNLLRLASRLSLEAASRSVRLDIRHRPKAGGAVRPLTPEAVPALQPGDHLQVKVRNDGAAAVDVTLLYVDARSGISALFPTGSGEINRLEPGAERTLDDIEITDNDGVTGLERLLAITVPAEKHAERTDFSFLAQPPLRSADAVATRGGPVSDEVQAFLDAAYADHRTRGASPKAPGNRTGMQVFTFDLKAPVAR